MEKILVYAAVHGEDTDGNLITTSFVQSGFFYGLCAPITEDTAMDVARQTRQTGYDIYTRAEVHAQAGDLLEIRGKKYPITREPTAWSRNGENIIGYVLHATLITPVTTQENTWLTDA